MEQRAPIVVIVAFDSDAHLSRCLESLHDLEVLVVDNGAAESTRDICRTAGAAYVATSGNLGFAAAVNVALDRVPGRDVLLLNPDARVEASAVHELQRALRDPQHRRAAVGPTLFDDGGEAENSDWPLPSPQQVWADAVGLTRLLSGRRFVTGAVLMLRAEAIAELGGFDERYFLYAEEADWQRRAQDAGWEVAVIPEIAARHIGAGSSSDNSVREAHFQQSGRAFMHRWYGAVGSAVMRTGSIAAASRRAVVGHAGGRKSPMRQLKPAATSATGRPTVVHVVCSSSFAGVERSMVDVATEQHRRGWRVVVVGGDPSSIRRALPPGVLTLPGSSVLEALRSLRRMDRADVVHAHMTAGEVVAMLAKRRLGARLVTTRHFAAHRGSKLSGRLVRRTVTRSIDHQFAISEFVASAIESPSTVVPNGVRDGGPPRARDKTVLVMQRLEAEKQTEVALQAWAVSGLGAQGWTLVVHGRGSQLDLLKRLSVGLGCADSVDIAGFAHEPRQVLARASVLLATAPAEPFGLTVAEAMAEGIPVLAADGGAHREVLGPDGHYFPPGDVDAAARELRRLAQLSADDRTALGERLRARQEILFTVEKQVSGLLRQYQPAAPRVALLSLEPWDDVWRRNQHFASRLVSGGSVSSMLFVNPPRPGLAVRSARHRPEPGIEVVTPPLIVPRRFGGHRVLATWLRRATDDVDLWWVNDPVAGDGARRAGHPTVYDVTDDWRELDQSPADRRRIVHAEDRLADADEVVVCSATLAQRWKDRYGVGATLIGNGVDVQAIRSATAVVPPGRAPHLIYVGTVHPSRIDVGLLRDLVDEVEGTLHLVGPESLDEGTRSYLDARGARRHGAVPSNQVPSWLAAADVLVCPHLVDEFTLSLDAIKAYEYLATSAPVVATPSSGFESTQAAGLVVVPANTFVRAVKEALGTGPFDREPPPDWNERAAQFATVIERAVARPTRERTLTAP